MGFVRQQRLARYLGYYVNGINQTTVWAFRGLGTRSRDLAIALTPHLLRRTAISCAIEGTFYSHAFEEVFCTYTSTNERSTKGVIDGFRAASREYVKRLT